jgi:hypothetical protein
LAEFDDAAALLAAARALREAGYEELDTYTPYPVHGLDEVLALPRSRIGFIVFPIAMAAAAFGYWLQWYCQAASYPLDVGGRPLNAAPAFVPITFETAVLFSAFAGFLSFFALTRLPALWHPVFEVPGFERASIDRFFLGVDARDPRFDLEATTRRLEELGAENVAWAVGRGR